MNIINKIRNILHKLCASEENYIENRNTAISLICNHLAKYQGSKDENIAVVDIWFVVNAQAPYINLADREFKEELINSLREENINAVQQIEVHFIQMKEIMTMTIEEICKDRLYISTRPVAPINNNINNPIAWLKLLGEGNETNENVICLDCNEKNVWNIGRTRTPTNIDVNDIVINNSCRNVSRQHAAIIFKEGEYFLRCKIGGCRDQGGQLTQIIRATGTEEELYTTTHYSQLEDGDIIQISDVHFRFSLTDPRHNNI